MDSKDQNLNLNKTNKTNLFLSISIRKLRVLNRHESRK